MSAAASMPEGRRQDIWSKVARKAAQTLRTRALRPRAPEPLVTFTFDDIPASAADAGAAALERYDARGTFYVAGGLIGQGQGASRFADAAAIRRLADAGHEIGCHTFAHPDMQRLDAAAVRADIARNGEALRAIDPSLRPTSFAYPYGSFAWTQKRVVQRHFGSARGTREGLNVGPIDLGHLRAVRLYDHAMDRARLERLCAEALARRGWLIFYTHDVAPDPSIHGCTPGLLATALATVRRKGLPAVTVAEALRRLGG